jgi:3-oxoacyl-[acyl-carrier protein] reductase
MHHDGRLSGKIAIVTGAASGIGEAIAALYLNEGARVVLCDLPGHGLMRRFLNQPHVRCVEVDVAAEEAPARLVGAAVREFGGLDVLVNNAGTAFVKPFEETADADFDRLMAVNVRAVFRLSREAVAPLRARGGGSIINLASLFAGLAAPQLSAYVCSKHAVLGLTRALAVDLGPYGIRVNALQPGAIVTGMTRGQFEDAKLRADWERKAPLGRLGDPVEAASVALFLASEEARYVTGAALAVDGGAAVSA